MTIEEIFSQIAAHMVEGLMMHSQMSDYFGFLGLKGYQECHKYHYFEENCNYRKISNYYLCHYNKLILEGSAKNPNIIPESWYKYTRQDVNTPTRKSSIQTGFEKWIKWERDTKKLYEKFYQELMILNEVASAIELKKYIVDVDYELAEAIQKELELKAIDYDMSLIVDLQKEKYEEYADKIKEVNLC